MEISRLPRAITGVEPQSFMVPSAGKHILLRTGTAEIPSQYALQPRGHVEIPAPAPVSALRKKHCAAQAEYGRLAAQTYSPSDAMSQARFCLNGMKKVQRRARRIFRTICTLKRGLSADVSLARAGVVLKDFPRRQRPRCIAPCGGVVWLGVGDSQAIAGPGRASRAAGWTGPPACAGF